MAAFAVKVKNTEVRVSLERRSDAWHYCFWFDGKRHRKSTHENVERAAREVARRRVVEITGLSGCTSLGMGSAITDYLDSRWAEADRKNNLTFHDASGRLNQFSLQNPRTDIGLSSEAEALDITQRFVDRRKNGRSARNDKNVLSAFFGWLIVSRRVSWMQNPALSPALRLPPLEDVEPEPATDDQIRTLLEKARGHDIWPVVVLCLGCGLRPAEAARAQWDHIDFHARIIRVLNLKGVRRRTREVCMNQWVCDEIGQLKTPGESLFPFNRSTAFDMMARVGSGVTLQMLRRTACNKAIESGMKLIDYVQQFGHNLATAEKHYLKYGRKGARLDAMDALNMQSLCNTATKTATPNL
jgi:integrase